MVLEVANLLVSVLVPPATDLAKSVVDPVSSRLGYVFHYKKYFNDLKSKVEGDLLRMQHDINGRVDADRANGMLICESVEHWIKKVVDIQKETEALTLKAQHITSNFQGWGKARYNLGKNSKNKSKFVDDLLREGSQFVSVSYLAGVPDRIVENFLNIDSRKPIKDEVIQALQNHNLVGVFGMAGVGKTTLVKQILEEVVGKLFDKVVLVTVSQSCKYESIQQQIAERLGLTLNEEALDVRASRLFDILKKEKKILLILDDTWGHLELANVGIVLGGSSKVLISSRCISVCTEMNSKKNIKVTRLSDKDSLKLFDWVVGDNAPDAERIGISKVIVDECGGLPLAIVTVARKLKGKINDSWKAVIPLLKMSEYKEMVEVNTSIKMSYDVLNRSTKVCFLLCALFPKDHKINLDRLIGYAMGEGLLGDGEIWEVPKSNMCLMVDELVSSGLLLTDDDKGYVKMHTIFRHTAISIAREDGSNSIMRAGLHLKRWPTTETGSSWRISLMSNDVQKVPDTPECSQLITLSLASNKLLNVIPNPFFGHMQRLGTLDLSGTGISSFPQFLSPLKNCLRSLYLDDCKIVDISLIGNLEALEILSLERTGISQLPDEVKKLPNLKKIYPNNLNM